MPLFAVFMVLLATFFCRLSRDFGLRVNFYPVCVCACVCGYVVGYALVHMYPEHHRHSTKQIRDNPNPNSAYYCSIVCVG